MPIENVYIARVTDGLILVRKIDALLFMAPSSPTALGCNLRLFLLLFTLLLYCMRIRVCLVSSRWPQWRTLTRSPARRWTCTRTKYASLHLLSHLLSRVLFFLRVLWVLPCTLLSLYLILFYLPPYFLLLAALDLASSPSTGQADHEEAQSQIRCQDEHRVQPICFPVSTIAAVAPSSTI